jgi:hypothetical protein
MTDAISSGLPNLCHFFEVSAVSGAVTVSQMKSEVGSAEKIQ